MFHAVYLYSIQLSLEAAESDFPSLLGTASGSHCLVSF